MARRVLLLVILAAVALPLSAFAEIREGSFEFTPNVGAILFDGKENLEMSPIIGGKFGYNFTKRIGLEAALDYFNADINHDRRASGNRPPFGAPSGNIGGLLYHLDAVYHIIPEGRFNPFVLIGAGGAHFNVDDGKDSNRFLANAGVGAKYWLTDSTALRLDVRDVIFFNRPYHNLATTLGLVIAFGGKEKAVPPPPPPPPPAPKPEPKPEPKPVVPPPPPEPKPEPAPAPMPAPKKIILEDIHFDFDKATLTDAARSILAKNIEALKEDPGVNIIIEGHACAHGQEEHNMRLSDRRANAVKEYIVKEGGIAEGRLSTITYGETKLLMPETPTPKNKESKEAKANRRVHFEVVVK